MRLGSILLRLRSPSRKIAFKLSRESSQVIPGQLWQGHIPILSEIHWQALKHVKDTPFHSFLPDFVFFFKGGHFISQFSSFSRVNISDRYASLATHCLSAAIDNSTRDLRQDLQIRLNSDTTAVRVTAAISQAGAGAHMISSQQSSWFCDAVIYRCFPIHLHFQTVTGAS